MRTRKDLLPKETIARVEKILNNIGVSVVIKEKQCYEQYWYSVRLEINGLEGVGVNGKGISEEYALASAYGELMERLQSGTLIDNLYSAFHNIEDYNYFNTYEELIDSLQYMCPDKNLEHYKIQSRKIYKKATYFDCIGKKEVELPEWFIDMDCMTNGLCAGNTFHEAVVQGIFEVFERHVRRRIYEGKTQVSLIQESELKNLAAYKMLYEIRNKGYEWNVIDCTDGGRFPVLGVIIWDKLKENYIFVMGADLDMDICIQRCITEMFQGRNFNFLFRKYLKSKYDIYQDKELECNEEYHKAVTSNDGRVPYHVLYCNKYSTQWTKVFNEQMGTNKEVYERLYHMLKEGGYTLYIRDMSYLGFPTYRVYIPGLSEVIDATKCYLLHDVAIGQFVENICKIDVLDEDKVEDIINQAYILYDIPFNKNISFLQRMKGVVLREKQYVLDNDYLFFILNKRLKRDEECIKSLVTLIDKYPHLKREIFMLFMNHLDTGIDSIEIETNSIVKKENELPFICCPDCEKCNLKSVCQIDNWKNIVDKLHYAKDKGELGWNIMSQN